MITDVHPPLPRSLFGRLRDAICEAIIKRHLIQIAEQYSKGEVTREDFETFSRGDFTGDEWRYMTQAMHRYAEDVCATYANSVLDRMPTVGTVDGIHVIVPPPPVGHS